MRFPPLFNVFCGAFCLGFAPIFVKLVALPPTLIGVYRCLIAGTLLMALSFLSPRRGPVNRKWVWPAGLVFAADLYVWHRSVVYAGAGLGTILGNTQVFYTSLFGLFFLGEVLKTRFWVAVALAFLGVYLLIGFRSEVASEHYWLGVVLGLVTGAVYALYILCMRQAERTSGLGSPRLLAEVSLLCAACLFAVCLIENSLVLPSASQWAWLLSLSIIAQVIGWWLISSNLPKIPISQAGLVLLTQPAMATLLGAWLFAEPLGPAQLCGALATFGAIYLGATGRRAAVNLHSAKTDK